MSSDEAHTFTEQQFAAIFADAAPYADGDEVSADGESYVVEVVSGEEGLSHIDPGGSGVLGTIKRAIQEERVVIEEMADALEAGGSVVFIPDVSSSQRPSVAELLRDAGAKRMFHFDEYTWVQIDG